MTHSRLVLLFFSFLFLSSCFGFSPAIVDRTEVEYDIKAANDKNRDDVIKRTARTIRGDTQKCEDKEKSHKCYEYCDEMFKRKFEDDCEELTVAQVEAIWSLHDDLLKEPDSDELEDIDLESFDLYLNVSIEALDDLIDEYSSRDAKEFLIWLINNEDVAEIFRNEDEDHKSLEGLLKEFAGSYTSSNHDISKPFLKRLDRDKLIEEALESEFMLSWFQEYINDKNSACERDTETRACFAVYCKIGEGMDDDAREDWLDNSEDFESYIEDIIDEKVNSQQGAGNNRNASGWVHEDASGSSRDEIEDVGDIDDWVDDLCQGLTDGTAGGSGGEGNSGNSDNDDNSDEDEEDLNPPSLCSSVNTETACINRLISNAVSKSDITLDNSKEALVWIFSKASRADKFLKKAKNASTRYAPLEKFLSVFVYVHEAGQRIEFSSRTADIYTAFVVDVKPNKNLMELALDTNTANYIIDYISLNRVCSKETNTGWGKGVSVGCFRDVYCSIAHYGNLSVADLKKWLDTPNFKAYLTKLIKTANGIDAGPFSRGARRIVRTEVLEDQPALPSPLEIDDTGIVANWKTRLCRLREIR